jgi:hypothetical protein
MYVSSMKIGVASEGSAVIFARRIRMADRLPPASELGLR